MRGKKKSLREEIERINLISEYVVGVTLNENKLILESDFMFPIDSNEFNIGYDQETMGSSQKVLDKDLAVHNSDFGGGDARHKAKGGHKGVDIFAKKGTPLIACVSGVISKISHDKNSPGQNTKTANTNNRDGGNTVTILGDDGQYYYYAHMDKISEDLDINDEISRGTYLGTVGDTGNARGTHPHLHFSIYTSGWSPINPFETLKDSLGLHTVSGIEYGDVELDSNISKIDSSTRKSYEEIIDVIEGGGTILSNVLKVIEKNVKNCSDLKNLNKAIGSSKIDDVKYKDLYDYINSDIDILDHLFSEDTIKEIVNKINKICPGSVKYSGDKIVKI